MTVPTRFVADYPERCLTLLDMAEGLARKKDLLTSFALLAASSVLVIPYERLRANHPIRLARESRLYGALRDLERKPWSECPFWSEGYPGGWQFSRIMGDPNDVDAWSDEDGVPSMSAKANTVNKRKAGEVLRVLRNALAHGNVVYLNKNGREESDTPVHFIAFLSRYEEDEEQKKKSVTYRVVAVSDENFLGFLRHWARWLAHFPPDHLLDEAA